ncbi:hypothetical protein QPB21_001818 [Vibrio alginolyticus]|uniref:hypothetical protein n=1 Tax=Vibrio harveyi group TaxID=717610 RepID=UPI00040255F3|nr:MULTISPECIES: hypothetical protein [Vibrio harveyi group]ELB1639369.1 hypothetical protein [Vibrio alginolyticus]EGQ8029186.1 hypothetical protein [Vibrio parahaemolyticus]EGQ8923077.1 hypothetical protein [Vibrio parahaemolyticus]EGR2857226.1 hypothetical protein [Vibrio parahaemolyticus]EGR2943891.1 hypothetical protein [Vibrio parahaemolyticus]
MRPKVHKDILDQFDQGINRERISQNIGCCTVCRIIKAHEDCQGQILRFATHYFLYIENSRLPVTYLKA